MRRRANSTDIMSYSFSELTFVLLIVAIGFAAVLYGYYNRSVQEISILKEEVNFLNEILAEKENAIVPCWRRPEGIIPELVGTITIHSNTRYSISHSSSGRSESFEVSRDERDQYITKRLLNLFKEERAYAKEKNCYIRMKIINETNDFSIYKGLGLVLRTLGVVLVNE